MWRKLQGWRGSFRNMLGPTPWRASLCLILAGLAGFAGHAAQVPLAWVLGPMLVTAAFAIGGIRPIAPTTGRRLGQIIIGSSIGLYMTLPVVLHVLGWVPLMIVTAVVSICLSAVLSVGLAHFAGINAKTAYFSLLPGGLTEMANIGSAVGAQSEPIALSQALRVALVVCILPQLILHTGTAGHEPGLAAAASLPLATLPLLLVAGLGGALLMGALRLNNPWSIGALFGVAALTASGWLDGRMPYDVYYLGQYLIGIAIGARFRREIVRRLLRLTVVASAFAVLLMAALLGYAGLMTEVTGIDFASAALASSPGGFAEMTVTAQTLHLDVALVAAFHILRAFFVNGLATYAWAILDRTGLFTVVERLLARRDKR
jgi:membrane AbrB-like protein